MIKLPMGIINELEKFRDGNKGYYQVLEKLSGQYWNGLMSVEHFDMAIDQLKEDFARAKESGWNNIIWEVL